MYCGEKELDQAYAGINSLEKNYIKVNEALNAIKKLEDNWNDNGACSFSAELIEKCRRIAMQLEAEPFVCSTACGSIQFEYEKEDGEYLETLSDGEKEYRLRGRSATDKMKQLVVDFYG